MEYPMGVIFTGDLALKRPALSLGADRLMAQAARRISLPREILVGGLQRQDNLAGVEVHVAEPTLFLRLNRYKPWRMAALPLARKRRHHLYKCSHHRQ